MKEQKVWLVLLEDCYCYGDWYVTTEIFKSEESAKSYAKEKLENFLKAENIDIDKLPSEEEGESGEWVVARAYNSTVIYLEGYYVENHFRVEVREQKIKE